MLGLYIVGRPDAELRQLENAIVVERRTNQLRIISTEYLLSLAEMRSEYGVAHEEILTVLRPSGPRIDPIVDLITRHSTCGSTFKTRSTYKANLMKVEICSSCRPFFTRKQSCSTRPDTWSTFSAIREGRPSRASGQGQEVTMLSSPCGRGVICRRGLALAATQVKFGARNCGGVRVPALSPQFIAHPYDSAIPGARTCYAPR